MLKIPQFIAKHIKDVSKYLQVDIGQRQGITDYIDFLTKEDFLNNTNVIYGFDNANRFFISVLFKNITQDNLNDKNESNTKEYNIMTLFQRYSNEPYFFVSCGDTFIWKGDVISYHFLKKDRNINIPLPNQYANFFRLINDGELNITYNVNKKYKLDDEYFNCEKTLCYKLFY